MTVREALRHLDARRARRLDNGHGSWTVEDTTAVAMVKRYVVELETEHPISSRLLRSRLDRADS